MADYFEILAWSVKIGDAMTMQRVDDWDLRLGETVAEWEEKILEPFYGVADCCAYTSDCVRAITADGFDPWAEWKGSYSDARGAAEEIRKRGYKSLFLVLQSIFGRPVHIAFAKTGDIVYANLGLDAPQLGICLGEQSSSCAPDGRGLIRVPTLKLHKCFHV